MLFINKMDDNSLIIFKAITKFVSVLCDNYGKKQKSLQLYDRLIKKTTVSHEKVILKHIDCFRKFCVQNRSCIVNKKTNWSNTTIVYSDRVFINISMIFSKADKADIPIIWDHLLTISALTDPQGNAKKVLKDQKLKMPFKSDGGKEDEFLSGLIDKVSDNVDPDSKNPMEAVTGMLSSGVFTELVSDMNTGLESGELSLGRLMGSVQNMMTKMNPSGSAPEGMPDIGGMMGEMTEMMEKMDVETKKSPNSDRIDKDEHTSKKSDEEEIRDSSDDGEGEGED